jgi:Protein of unknown function (DUF4232)
MRPTRIIAAVALAAAVAATGSYLAVSTATHPSAASQPPATASRESSAPTGTPNPGAGPDLPPSTANPSGDPPAPVRCDPSALQGSVQGSDGAAGTIWITVQLRNASTRTCTVRGIPQVRLLDAQGQSVTAPSRPEGPAGSLVVLRPGRAASFEFHYPNACDSAVVGSRLRVTLPLQQGSVSVPLDTETRFGTCASVGVQALQDSTTTSMPPVDRISDPQVAADRLVAAWLRGDRAAAGKLTTSPAVTERLFSESPPAHKPGAHPCRLVDLGLYLCSYRLTPPNELNVWVMGGASVGYGVSNVEFVD